MNDSKDFESKKLKHMMVQLLEQQQEQLKLLQEELARERTRANGGQTGIPKETWEAFKGVKLQKGKFWEFKRILEFNFQTYAVDKEDQQKKLLFKCLNAEQLVACEGKGMLEQKFKDIMEYLKLSYGTERQMNLREFLSLRQEAGQSAVEFAQKVWRLHSQIKGASEDLAMITIQKGLSWKIASRLNLKYEDISTLMNDLMLADEEARERNFYFYGSRKVASSQNKMKVTGKPELHDYKGRLAKRFDISMEVLEERWDARRCLKCGKSDHHFQNCSNKAQMIRENARRDQCIDVSDMLEDSVEYVNDDSLLLKGLVNEKMCPIKVDTGAEVSVVDAKFVDQIFPCNFKIVSTDNSTLKALGQAECKVSLSSTKTKIIKAIVMKDLNGKGMLLGYKDFLSFGGKVSIEENKLAEPRFNTDFPDSETWIQKIIDTHYSHDDTKKSLLPPVKIHLRKSEDEKNISSKPYRLPKDLQIEMGKMLKVLVDEGILIRKEGETACPAFLVPKPNGKDYRFVLDFRKLNASTRGLAASMDTLEDIIDLAAGKSVFTVLDLSDGFFQIELEENSKRLTGVVTSQGRFEFQVLPQGIKQAPTAFHERIKHILKELTNSKNYIDDIIIMSSSLEEAKEDFIHILKILSAHNIKCNWSKAQIFKTEVQFLGCVIDGVKKRAGEKAKRLGKFRAPKTKKQLKKLLGKIGAFRGFVKNFSIKMAPLYFLLRREVIFQWHDTMTEIIESVIREINSTQLFFPENEEKLFITCDASKYGIGATLNSSDGKLIRCMSEILSDTQVKW